MSLPMHKRVEALERAVKTILEGLVAKDLPKKEYVKPTVEEVVVKPAPAKPEKPVKRLVRKVVKKK